LLYSKSNLLKRRINRATAKIGDCYEAITKTPSDYSCLDK